MSMGSFSSPEAGGFLISGLRSSGTLLGDCQRKAREAGQGAG